MRTDVALDYAVFQLTPSRNRFELVVVCGEENERLASGLLKPFVVHLKAAEDQYATGTKEIKLLPPPGYGYGSKPETSAWFTKGTIERFVRFVSTPEVLERVGTVEAELVQLDGAIRDHAIESIKVDVSQSSAGAAASSAASSILLTATTDQAPTPTPSRRNSLDEAENPAPDDNARRRLLRAMEARKMLLHKEQGMAFARATAAGFDVQQMEHLLVFADCFGANRLGDACVMYSGIFKKTRETGLWDENEWPLSDTTSLRNVPTSPELRKRDPDLWSDEAGDLKDDLRVRSHSKHFSEDLSLRGYAGNDALRKHDPLGLALSPSRGREFNADYSTARGGVKKSSWDEASRISNGQERSYTDDSLSGNTRRIPSLSADSMYADNVNEGGNDIGRGHRQRRAWGPPPQFLAHQIPVSVGFKSKSGPLLSGSDGYPMPNSQTAGITPSHRVVESLPSWVGQADQPWRPGSTEPSGHGLPRLLVPKAQAHGVAGNGHIQSGEPVVKPPETNGNVLPTPAASFLEHKRRQGAAAQEKTGIPVLGSTGVTNSAAARGGDGSRPGGGKSGDRPQGKPVVRRASSPRRRSSSPMRRVQVGRNSMRRSGVMILKSVNYASTKPASNTQAAAKDSDPSEDNSDDGGKNDVRPHEGDRKLGFVYRDGLRLDTEPETQGNEPSTQEALPDQSPSRASSGWNPPGEYEAEAKEYRENGGDRAPGSQAGPLQSPKNPRGRFYEVYREKRDARLRDESGLKKAERDAKLKSMHEVLEHRKAEMAARKGRGMGNHKSDGEAQVLAEKLRVSKTEISPKVKKPTDDDEGKRLEDVANQRRERIAARSSPSPPSHGAPSVVSSTSTPKALEKQPQPQPQQQQQLQQPQPQQQQQLQQPQPQQQQQQASTPTALPTMIPTPSLTPKGKPHAARRLSSPQKASAAAFRGTLIAPAATAPGPAPKLVRTFQRKLQSAPPIKEVENPMSRSVPNLAELRKENTKPSAVRNSTARNAGSKIPGIRGVPAPPESNGSKIGSKAAAADEKKRRAGTRKSAAGAMETTPDVLAPLKAPPPEAKTSKRLSLASAAVGGDSKPFLRKGRGIGPGSGPNVRKSKVAAAPEPAKPEEDAEKSVSDSEHELVKAVVADQDAMDSTSSVDDEKESAVRADPTQASQLSIPEASSDFLIKRPSTPPQSLSLVLSDDDEMIRPEEWQEPDVAENVRRAAYADQHADLASQSSHVSTLRPFLNEGSESVAAVIAGTLTPPQRSSPIHSIPLRALSPKGAEPLDLYSIPRILDVANLHLEPPMVDSFTLRGIPTISSSPATSPAPPQIQMSHSPDVHASSRLRKKWLSSQKVVAPPPVKEAPRGLKRLLKFGLKKNKSSAASTTSDSPSDIDDDAEFTIEHARSDELSYIGARSLGSRIPGKASSLIGPPAIPEDSTTLGDSGARLVSIPFVRSSIPTAPAHFRTRDEHVGGSSLLKAPRSFFSLSSFRSKSKQ